MTTSSNTGLRCTGLFLAGLASTSAALAGDTAISFIVRPPAVLAAALGSGDATFNRLRQNCSTLSGSGTSVHYDTVQFTNPTSAAMTLDVRTQAPGGNGTGTCGVERDTVMMAYSGSFNPAAPTQQCIGFNDDATSPNLDRCSRISGLVVAPQSTVVIVIAAFDNGQSFDYDLRFDGTAPTQTADALFRTGFEDGEGALQPEASRSVSGQITIDAVVAPVAADSTMDRLLAPDGQYFGFLQLAPITLSGMSDLGPIQTRFQWFDASGGFGTVPASGAATLSYSGLQLRLQSVLLNGNPVPIGGECRFGPVSWSFTGQSSGGSIDVAAPSFTIPPTSDACGGFQAQLNGLFSGTSNAVELDIQR